MITLLFVLVEIACSLLAMVLRFAFNILSSLMVLLDRLFRFAFRWFEKGVVFAYRQFCKWYDRHYEYRTGIDDEIISI